jgi:hypothetical protein
MVHLFGSLAPVKSGVAVGDCALTVQNAKEKRTQARIVRMDPPIRRNNCAPFETISNFFIKALFKCGDKYPISPALWSTEIPKGSSCCQDRHLETAGNGNRTRMASLEGWNFTIKLCPRGPCQSGGLNCSEPVPLPSDFSRGLGPLDISVTGV